MTTQTLTLIGISITVLIGLPIIINSIKKGFSFFTRIIFNKDIHSNVLKHRITRTKGTTEIKIAYAGMEDLILRDIRIIYRLNLPAPFDRFLAHYHIGISYITCNMLGLATLLGTQHYKYELPMIHLMKMPRFLKYPLSVFVGVWWLYIVLLMSIIPVGWIFLNSGPYGRFSLESITKTMKITDHENNNVILPVILKPGTETILNIKYTMGLNAKGFSINTPYRIIQHFPKRTLLPPKPGNFIWIGIPSINVFVGNRWNRLSAELGKREIIGIGSK